MLTLFYKRTFLGVDYPSVLAIILGPIVYKNINKMSNKTQMSSI